MQGKMNKGRFIKLIHIAKAQLALCDEDYRAIVESVSGKTSCSELTLFELEQVLKAMKKLGFKFKRLETKENEVGWDTSKEQMDYIKGMWKLVARDKSERALYRFIKKITGADHPQFMNATAAQKVIIALRKMMVGAGLNPDYKENGNDK